ncbi:hypothetical protein DFH07DRAFT_768296 [Mycena maculata]|uniref:Uncharacterized protein n=1 Tax=Mycena maculata TaxID=230809 RepID=A0AAD7JSZ6_9AGAR|nr:hypothetical protein DFH07DRAFT_768296 [Mycena maculata]
MAAGTDTDNGGVRNSAAGACRPGVDRSAPASKQRRRQVRAAGPGTAGPQAAGAGRRCAYAAGACPPGASNNAPASKQRQRETGGRLSAGAEGQRQEHNGRCVLLECRQASRAATAGQGRQGSGGWQKHAGPGQYVAMAGSRRGGAAGSSSVRRQASEAAVAGWQRVAGAGHAGPAGSGGRQQEGAWRAAGAGTAAAKQAGGSRRAETSRNWDKEKHRGVFEMLPQSLDKGAREQKGAGGRKQRCANAPMADGTRIDGKAEGFDGKGAGRARKAHRSNSTDDDTYLRVANAATRRDPFTSYNTHFLGLDEG